MRRKQTTGAYRAYAVRISISLANLSEIFIQIDYFF